MGALLGAAPGGPGGRPRLLTLTGAGGIGKTRLALSVAALRWLRGRPRSSGSAAAERVFVSLGPLAGPELVPRRWRPRSGCARRPDARCWRRSWPPSARVRRCWCWTTASTCVDACAALVEAAARRLPRRCGCWPPAGSRWRPRRASLAACRPWPCPTRRRRARAGGGLRGASAAVRLFVERAAGGPAGLRPDRAERPGGGRRSAGAWTASRSPSSWRRRGCAVLARRADRRPPRRPLAACSPAAAGRRRRASRPCARRWTGATIPSAPPERALFDRLSVFAGGWTLEAAEAVCAAGAAARTPASPAGRCSTCWPAWSTARWWWCSRRPADEGAVRYRLLEPLREYAAERLAARGADSRRRRRQRHAAFYADRGGAGAAGPRRAGRRRPGWPAWRWSTPNLRAALTWCAGALPGAAGRRGPTRTPAAGQPGSRRSATRCSG